MRPPIRHHREIPFFYDKSEQEFKKDNYERYESMVTRQTALHLADQLWKGYPWQSILDLITTHLHLPTKASVAELGCSVGRIVGELAKAYPESRFWGLDYSYQMLRRAKECWVDGKTIRLDFSIKGMKPVFIPGKKMKNLQFGLAKAEDLPFAENSQDALISSFLLDRLEDPIQGMKEMHRVLRPGAQVILVSPLNFAQAHHWEALYPVEKITDRLKSLGFVLDELDENLMVIEPMDVRGNVVLWKCLVVVGRKA